MLNRKIVSSMTMFVAACGYSAASGGFVNEDFASWHGSPDSSYYYWDTFTNAAGGPNSPDGDSMNAAVFNFGDPGHASITGGGNIYGFGGPLDIHTYAYSDSDVQAVQFNMSTGGSPFDWGNIALVYETADGGSGYVPNSGYNVNYAADDGWGGAFMNVSLSWDLSSIAGDITSVGIFAESLAPHASLDAVSIDLLVGAVPAPGALCLIGLAGMSTRRRRRS